MRPTFLSLLVLAACAAPAPVVTPDDGKGRPLQGWANGAVFYEIFVRSFQDSDGDGAGDLRGLISRLDYLNDGDPGTQTDLGIDAIWLMPVFQSPSYHGYDTTDYETINSDYGTNEDFADLLREAHQRGIRVIVDLVINHTGVTHPWFTESASSKTSPRRDWYVWSDSFQAWGQPWNPSGRTWHERNGAFYYGVFWSGMPDLNFRTAAVRDEMKRIATLWLNRGVDGFRVDAIRHLIETGPGATGQNDTAESHQYLKELAAAVRLSKPEATMVGEAWTETPIIAAYYGDTKAVPGGDEMPLNFNFPLARRIIEGVQAGDGSGIASKLLEVRNTYPVGATDVPFLTNHDQRRVASELGNDPDRLRMAASIMLTLPGTPFLYYGEELGLQNGPGGGDEHKRTPMPWDSTTGGGFTTGTPWFAFSPGRESTNVAAQTEDSGSLLSRYRKLIHARRTSAALTRGGFEILKGSGAVLAFLRVEGNERVLVAHNLGAEPQNVEFAFSATGAESLVSDPGVSLDVSRAAPLLTIPARSTGIIRLR